MTTILYHGTSVKNADLILAQGFKDRRSSGKRNWTGKVLSQAGFVYLTRAYPFFYGMNAAGNQKTASVLQVEVDLEDLYPDEDFIRQVIWHNAKDEVSMTDIKVDIRDYKNYALQSLDRLGNVAIEADRILRITGRKDFNVLEMAMFSDPSMSIMNYKFCGGYYRELTDRWWRGDDYSLLNAYDFYLNEDKDVVLKNSNDKI